MKTHGTTRQYDRPANNPLHRSSLALPAAVLGRQMGSWGCRRKERLALGSTWWRCFESTRTGAVGDGLPNYRVNLTARGTAARASRPRSRAAGYAER
jgi:hypothetical protein